jgi:hypothetical protein
VSQILVLHRLSNALKSLSAVQSANRPYNRSSKELGRRRGAFLVLPNAAALNGDERNPRIIKIDAEFKVVERLACGYLLGRDALKAYKAIIDEDAGQIIFPFSILHSRFPLPDRYNRTKINPRIFAARTVRINPGQHL